MDEYEGKWKKSTILQSRIKCVVGIYIGVISDIVLLILAFNVLPKLHTFKLWKAKYTLASFVDTGLGSENWTSSHATIYFCKLG
jgi:hypothetical protein